MKRILIILTLIVFTKKSTAQIDSTKLDTIAAFVKVNRCLKWNYYHANGVLLWGSAEYDTSLVPPNGYMAQAVNMKPQNEIINGYAVLRFYRDGSPKEILSWLDGNKKKITNRLVEPMLTRR